MSCKCEMTRDEQDKLIDLIISYGLSCRETGYAFYAKDPVVVDDAFKKRSQSFKEVLYYLSGHWV